MKMSKVQKFNDSVNISSLQIFESNKHGEYHLLGCVADVSEERIASIFRVEKSANPKNGGDTVLRNFGSHKIYTAPHPRRRHSS
jgi:uncharacterized protein YehS (DUF1456 family)